MRELLPDLPPENIVAEPAKRDTAAAVALGAGLGRGARSSRDDDRAAGGSRDQGQGGISENDADGGARRGRNGRARHDRRKANLGLPGFWLHRARRARSLAKEAPRRTTFFASFVFAKNRTPNWPISFVRKGNFRWNAGMFVWSVPTVLSEFNRHAPELADFISQVRATGNWEHALRDRFAKLPIISFDYAIMEKADRVLMVEASFDWDDVGGWRAVASYLPKDENSNAANCDLTTLHASNNIVFSDNPTKVALLGVHNLIVVRTEDAILVCNRHDAEKIKNLVGKLPSNLQ